MYIYTINYYISVLILFYLPVVSSYWQPVVNSDFAIDNQLSIATSKKKNASWIFTYVGGDKISILTVKIYRNP